MPSSLTSMRAYALRSVSFGSQVPVSDCTENATVCGERRSSTSAKVCTSVQLASRIVTSDESHMVPNHTLTGSGSIDPGASTSENLSANCESSSPGQRQLARLMCSQFSVSLLGSKPPSPSGNLSSSSIEPPPRSMGGAAPAVDPGAVAAARTRKAIERRIGSAGRFARPVPRARGASHQDH